MTELACDQAQINGQREKLFAEFFLTYQRNFVRYLAARLRKGNSAAAQDLGRRGAKSGGVIFVDEKTISPADIGGLVRALLELSKETGKWDWADRVYFLRRQR